MAAINTLEQIGREMHPTRTTVRPAVIRPANTHTNTRFPLRSGPEQFSPNTREREQETKTKFPLSYFPMGHFSRGMIKQIPLGHSFDVGSGQVFLLVIP